MTIIQSRPGSGTPEQSLLALAVPREDRCMNLALLLLLAACRVAAPLPEGDAFVRGLVSAQRHREAELSRYSYDVSEVRDELDGDGRVRKRRTRDFEVFVVRGQPVRRLVARDGRALSGRERDEQERHARELAEALAAGKAAIEEPRVRLSQMLERYRFLAVTREELDGRCAIAFDFTAVPADFALERDALLRRLAGRLWVDEAEHALMRVEVRNTSRIKLALGAFASISSLQFRIEFTRQPDGVWLPRLVESHAVGRKFLVSGFRVRTTTRYARYRRFEVEVQEKVHEAPGGRPNELW